MKKLLLFICVMLGLNCNCSQAQSNGLYEDLSVAEFSKFIENPEVQILDVRTPEEFSEGHIPDAININLYDPEFLSEAKSELVKSRPVAVYCRSGKRSAEAAGILVKNGYKVVNLEGGILAYSKSYKLQK